MLPTEHLLAFALLSFALIIVPGPNVLFVVSRSLQLGRAAGVCTAVGGQIGVHVQVAAVAFGIGALVERSVAVFTVIKLAGSYFAKAAIDFASLRSEAETKTAIKSKDTLLKEALAIGDGSTVNVISPILKPLQTSLPARSTSMRISLNVSRICGEALRALISMSDKVAGTLIRKREA